ncbi:MAG: hypothetical protein ACREDT_12050, partial [Methylocella sp.]
LNPLPLPVAQPKQIPAHNFKSFPPKNHYLIVSAKGLMSSNPRYSRPSQWRFDRGHAVRDLNSPEIEMPGICRAFCCKVSAFARAAVAFFGHHKLFGANDVNLVRFAQNSYGPRSEQGLRLEH